jgi:hypothetical protein
MRKPQVGDIWFHRETSYHLLLLQEWQNPVLGTNFDFVILENGSENAAGENFFIRFSEFVS